MVIKFLVQYSVNLKLFHHQNKTLRTLQLIIPTLLQVPSLKTSYWCWCVWCIFEIGLSKYNRYAVAGNRKINFHTNIREFYELKTKTQCNSETLILLLHWDENASKEHWVPSPGNLIAYFRRFFLSLPEQAKFSYLMRERVWEALERIIKIKETKNTWMYVLYVEFAGLYCV